MYGQMTAGGWSYIGSQGIVQGTYETFAACARKHFGGSLKGRLVLTGGMGGMGGAQPLAIKMNEGVCLDVEVDEARIRRRVSNGYCDRIVFELDEALEMALDAKASGTPLSVGLVGNCADVHPELVQRRIRPDIVTDQTSAHDPLGGYIPRGLSVSEAIALRSKDPKEYVRRSRDSIAIHVRAMLDFLRAGSIVFDYGNNIRGQAKEAGVEDAFAFQGFVPLFIRPLFAEGRGPFRWVAVTGNADDIIRRTASSCGSSRTTRPSLGGSDSRRSTSRGRASPPGCAGSHTESGRSSGGRSTAWSRRASSAGRSSSRGIIWTRAPWRPRTGRRRGCGTAPMRSRTGPCSTRY